MALCGAEYNLEVSKAYPLDSDVLLGTNRVLATTASVIRSKE